MEIPRKEKKVKKEKPKSGKTEEASEENQEAVSPKVKKIKKKAVPSEVDMNSPTSKKSKKKEDTSQDDIISPKTKSVKKPKEPIEKKVVSPKIKKAVKNEEPEEEIGAPKPKKMKKEKEMNGEIGEKSPKLKNGLSHSGPDSSSNEIASEESNSELEQEIPVEQKEGAFSNFPISEGTIKLLKARGVTFLFPIQAKTFHHVYSGKDLIAQARTGTGKTFSFAIPLIEKLLGELQDRKRGRAPQVLVLAPTRELANQVSRDFSDITKSWQWLVFMVELPMEVKLNACGMGLISWLGHQAVSKTICRMASWISPNLSMLSWMKLTRCWIWGLLIKWKKF